MKLIERRDTSPSIIDVDPYRPDSKTSSKQIENQFSDEEKFLDFKKTKQLKLKVKLPQIKSIDLDKKSKDELNQTFNNSKD